jgi:ATP-dependent RNA circularization protein (DNA/RNA ligase family)
MSKDDKPLGIKAYGSIGHLPNSRVTENDYHINDHQASLVTVKTRDHLDLVIVQEKLDGSNCSVALLNGQILALGRAGYLAQSSRFEMHQLFADWVRKNEDRFRAVLREGERICGEWLAYAHGTIYDLKDREPYVVFDIMKEHDRLPYIEFVERVGQTFAKPALLHIGQPISVRKALEIHKEKNYGCDEIEGVVYRMERKGKVDFLAKFVRLDKIDGKYLNDNIWLWRPEATEVRNDT